MVILLMSRSATPEEIGTIFEYIREMMPDLALRLDRICVNDSIYEGMFLSTRINAEDSIILNGLLFLKARDLGLIDKDGYVNVSMTVVKINNVRNIVLYFT